MLVLAYCLGISPCMAVGASRLPDARMERSREFKGPVSKGMATEAALSAARVAGIEAATRSMARLDELRLLLGSEVMASQPRPDPAALALAVLDETVENINVRGVPPDVQVAVTVRLSLGDTARERQKLADLLARPLWLDYYARAAELELACLKEYDLAAAPFLKPGASSAHLQAGRPPKDGTGSEAAVLAARLETAAAKLAAMRKYIKLLPELRGLGAQAQSGYLGNAGGMALLQALDNSLGEMLAAYPDNYLLLADYALVRLLRGDALEARRRLGDALALRPDFAPARDLRGVALLWLELPSLALDDFNQAVALEPYQAVFYENRALALKVLEQTAAMCADLRRACNLGSCGGLEWADREGLCR